MDHQQEHIFLGDNLSGIALKWQESQIINEPREIAYFLTHIAMVALTTAVNTIAVVVIRKKERNGLNNLIVLDCMMNVLNMMLSTFHSSPWFTMKSRAPCVGDQVIFLPILLWNRLVPVGIAMFRNLMVCHPVFCHNHGGEQTGMKIVKRTIFFLCLLYGAIIGIDPDKK